MPTDASVLDAIRRLVGEERALRAEHAERKGAAEAKVERLHQLEGELDQCWDLLRQRRALRAKGADPETASVRPASRVGSYLQ